MADELPYRSKSLSGAERRYYRDRFREARYAALANAEGFEEICYAIEELGIKLAAQRLTMDGYKRHLGAVAAGASQLHSQLRTYFSSFEALYEICRQARNDAMHTGVVDDNYLGRLTTTILAG